MQAQAAARTDISGSALDFQQNSLPFDEVLRFEDVEKTAVLLIIRCWRFLSKSSLRTRLPAVRF